MAFIKAILQKRRSKRIGALQGEHHKNNKNNNNRNKSRCSSSSRTCDDTASAASQTSTIELAAQQGKWESFILQVEASSPMDWSSFSNKTNGGEAEESVSSQDVEEIEVEASSWGASSQGSTPIHLALRYCAPLKVLEALLSICQRTEFGLLVPEECIDEAGQTPLHVAVAYGCSEDVVQRLLSGPCLLMPAVLRDNQGRTPMHIACCGASSGSTSPARKTKKSFWGPDPAAMQIWNRRRAVTILLEHYPEAACLRDDHGQTPLDYARVAGFSKTTVQELEFAVRLHGPSLLALSSVPDDASRFPAFDGAISVGCVSSIGMTEVEHAIDSWDWETS